MREEMKRELWTKLERDYQGKRNCRTRIRFMTGQAQGIEEEDWSFPVTREGEERSIADQMRQLIPHQGKVAESIKYRDVNLLDFLSEIFKIMEGKRISWNLSIYCRGGAFTALWMTLRLPPESLGPKVRDEAKECASTSMHEIERLIRAFPIAKSSRVINSKTGGKTTVEPLRLDRRGISLELLEPKAVERDRQREFERQEEVREEHERQELATYRRLVERV